MSFNEIVAFLFEGVILVWNERTHSYLLQVVRQIYYSRRYIGRVRYGCLGNLLLNLTPIKIVNLLMVIRKYKASCN